MTRLKHKRTTTTTTIFFFLFNSTSTTTTWTPSGFHNIDLHQQIMKQHKPSNLFMEFRHACLSGKFWTQTFFPPRQTLPPQVNLVVSNAVFYVRLTSSYIRAKVNLDSNVKVTKNNLSILPHYQYHYEYESFSFSFVFCLLFFIFGVPSFLNYLYHCDL